MLRDKDEELKRLSEALLAEEEENVSDATVVRKPSGKTPAKVRNTDAVDVDIKKYSSSVENPKPERLTGLVILMIFLTAGVVCAVIWWVLRLKGMI